MADVKVSALTALTGANLANGDQFLVTDVGSPNVSKSITADELAQGSQFTSRYVSQANEIRVGLASYFVWNNSTGAVSAPSLALGGGGVLPGFVKTTPTGQTISMWINDVLIPSTWSTCNIHLIYTFDATDAGDVALVGNVAATPTNGSAGSTTSNSVVIETLNGKTANRFYEVNLGGSGSGWTTGTAGYFRFKLDRAGGNAGDTATTTVRAAMMVLRKVS
jgi:hypothetical protein